MSVALTSLVPMLRSSVFSWAPDKMPILYHALYIIVRGHFFWGDANFKRCDTSLLLDRQDLALRLCRFSTTFDALIHGFVTVKMLNARIVRTGFWMTDPRLCFFNEVCIGNRGCRHGWDGSMCKSRKSED